MPKLAPDDVERLLARCRAGDERAWATLVREFSPMVYRIGRRAGLSAEDAADVHQAAFVALYRSLDRLSEPRALQGWLATTASREAVRVRSSARSHESVDIAPLEDVIAAQDEEAGCLAEAAEQSETVRGALEQLGAKCRELLTLLYTGAGASYRQVSSALNIPVGSIGPTRARCLDKLRQVLEAAGFFGAATYQRREDATLEGQER